MMEVSVDEDVHFERPPVQVGLVIDASASMTGAPIEAARQAAIELVEALADGDRLSVVVFGSRAQLVVPSVVIDDDSRTECREKIESIEVHGTTDMAAGLQSALADLEPHVGSGRVSRLVLLSDGIPNTPWAVEGACSRASGLGIPITALGFGLDYDEALLAHVAQTTGGAFTFLEQPDELVPLFRRENERLAGIVAQDLTLSLTTGPRVQIVEVVGQAVGVPTTSVGLALGDLSRGEVRTVVVRLSVGPHPSGATAELLDGQLGYRDPVSGHWLEEAVFVSAVAEDDEALLAQAAAPCFERELQNARAAAVTLQAVNLAREGKRGAAKEALSKAEPVVNSAADRLEDSRLREQAVLMGELSAQLADEEETIDEPEGAGEYRGSGAPVGGLGGPRAAPQSGLGGKLSSSGERSLRRAHSNAMYNLQTRPSDAASPPQ